jgi:hypothetical protein
VSDRKEQKRQYYLANREKMLAAARAWRAANPEKANAARRKWHAANRERDTATSRAWQAANREKARAACRKWYANNRETAAAAARERQRASYAADPGKFLAWNRKWRAANPEKVLAGVYAWRERNLEKMQAYVVTYRRDRCKNDPGFRVLLNCRNRVKNALRGIGAKAAHTMELLGCSVPELRVHLEQQFQPGMTWDNYGSWHIDHIRPCASFDLTDGEQQKKCFHFSNLQPLWARDNLAKGRKESR